MVLCSGIPHLTVVWVTSVGQPEIISSIDDADTLPIQWLTVSDDLHCVGIFNSPGRDEVCLSVVGRTDD